MPRKTADQRHQASQPQQALTSPAAMSGGNVIARIERLVASTHPTRLRILRRLRRRGPAAVGTIAADLNIAPGSVSHHCKTLHSNGFLDLCPDLAPDTRHSIWRAVPTTQSWSPLDAPIGTKAHGLLMQLERRYLQFTRADRDAWLDSERRHDPNLRQVATHTDTTGMLTPTQIAHLINHLNQALTQWEPPPDESVMEDRLPVRTVVTVHPVTW